MLLGDIECEIALDALAAPILALGARVYWIHGNHDADAGPEMWANLSDPARNPLTASGALHGRVTEIAGTRVAGLGGTFRARVWSPKDPPRLYSRMELDADLASLGPEWNERSRVDLKDGLAAMAIWPEDVENLATQRADILVTHEAPSSHSAGATVIDDLARRMGVKLIVHGHHHVCYRARAADGLEAQGVAAAWGVDALGAQKWTGEPQRWLGSAPPGWAFVTPTAASAAPLARITS